MRRFVERLLGVFDNNPWKTAGIVLFVSNLLLLADAELVLMVSLFLVFFYLILLSVTSFESLSKDRYFSSEESFSSVLTNIIKVLVSIQHELEKTLNLIYGVSAQQSTWLANSIFYRCVRIPKNKNYLAPLILSYLEDIKSQQHGTERLDLTSQEDKTRFINTTIIN